MQLQDMQAKKYFNAERDEEILHTYVPTSGAKIFGDTREIDARILNAIKSGCHLNCTVRITTWRIVFALNAHEFDQVLELHYNDLAGINVDIGWLSLGYGTTIQKKNGYSIYLKATRPQFVAVELWIEIARAIVINFACAMDMTSGMTLIRQLDAATVRVPDDFISCKGSDYVSSLLSMGYCLPENSKPYIDANVANQFVQDVYSQLEAEYSQANANTAIAPVNSQELKHSVDLDKGPLVAQKSTSDSLKQGSISATAGTVPKFIPSLAIQPKGFDSTGTPEGDLKYALSKANVHLQSFFNDHNVVTANGISDDIISLPCFDEGLYCSLVREMHRYSLVEITDNHVELAKKNAGLGAMVGSFIGIMTGNMFAPFLGHAYGKNLTDRGKPIEEFLPDPNLLFYQDDNSYLSWSRAQVNSPRLRRIIFNRQLSEDGKVYFRLIPAIVTADSVLPVQLFKVNDSTYFYRPLAAGIDRNQPNYDTIRIQKKYFHLRGEGMTEKIDFEIDIYGNDVEPNEKIRLHRFTGQSLDYFYADFKILPGSIF